MLNIQTFFVFFAVFNCLQHCLAKDQLWGVRLFTGDLPDAGTHGLLYLRLFGQYGLTRWKVVWDLGKHPDRQRNMADYSYVYFKDIGHLKAIVLHNEHSRWFLRRVEMEKLDNHTSIWIDGIQTIGLSSDRVRTFYVFNTSYWFNHEREKRVFWYPATTTDRTYILRVITSDMENAGTVTTAFIQFYNSKNKLYSDMIETKYDDGRHVLRRGTTNKFQYTTKYIGIPDKALMWFKRPENTIIYDYDALYRLDRVELEDLESDRKRRVYTFTGPGWMAVDIRKTYHLQRTKIHWARVYGMRIWTSSNEKFVGTDAPVSIQFIGKNGKKSKYFELWAPFRNDFESGTRYWYEITIEDVGMLHSIKFKIGPGDPWKFLKIFIKWSLQTDWVDAYYADCDCWIYKEKTLRVAYTPKSKPHDYE